MIFTGTLINAFAVVTGSSIGLLLHARLPSRVITIAFQAIGLFTIFLGTSMALKAQNMMIVIFSLVIGSVIGELLGLQEVLNKMGDKLKLMTRSKDTKFTEALTTAFMLFCIGSMTILGAIEEGLGNTPNLIMAKSLMDGCSSLALAAALGIGVFFAVIPLVIYQGSLTLFASYLDNWLSEPIIDEMTAVGGVMMIGLGITILEIKELRVINMIPSLVLAVILGLFFL